LLSRSGSTLNTEDLLQQVRERERRKAEAVGRDYAARPASYKGSLSLKLDRYTTRRRSKSPAKRSEVVVVQKRRSPSPAKHRESSSDSKPAVTSREAEERMRKLRKMYGDASMAKRSDEDE
jgi:pre-mRNA-splicing factor 38B